jgi:hypothetical protein
LKEANTHRKVNISPGDASEGGGIIACDAKAEKLA